MVTFLITNFQADVLQESLRLYRQVLMRVMRESKLDKRKLSELVETVDELASDINTSDGSLYV